MSHREESEAPVVAIIPARGGSKGIPDKNLQRLAGVSLLAHTIQQARQARTVDEVWVSTDDSAIASEAETWGAQVSDRPPSLATDSSPSEAALLHTLRERREGGRPDADLVVFLQCTSPFRTPDDIDAAVARLRESDADSLFSAAPLHGFVWVGSGPSSPRPLTYSPQARPRRQEMDDHVVENGSIYIFKPRILEQTDNRLGGRIGVYTMGALSALQIDEPEDLELHRRLGHLHPWRPIPPGAEAIRLLALDFDGVMTDDRVLIDETGREAVLCSRGDGLGLERLRASGLEVVVVSKERNPVVQARCRKLGIECTQGCDDKLTALKALASERSLGAEQIAFVGNDLNDIATLGWVGLPIAVRNAHPEVLRAAMMTTTAGGGQGAVREVCDLLLDVDRSE